MVCIRRIYIAYLYGCICCTLRIISVGFDSRTQLINAEVLQAQPTLDESTKCYVTRLAAVLFWGADRGSPVASFVCIRAAATF